MGKKIFISDIHLGDERSMEGDHPYGWCIENIQTLGNFLTEIKGRGDVTDVVILGDLFDEWVIPGDVPPLISYRAICENEKNSPVINGLKTLCQPGSGIAVSYVPGNHDMSMSIAGIPEVKDYIRNVFPGIKVICDDTYPLGAFTADGLVAEHGNRFCLFNAPDRWAGAETNLPLGYFISRMVAQKVQVTGHHENQLDIFARILVGLMTHTNFVPAFYDAVTEDANLNDASTFQLQGVPGFGETETVAAIRERYKDLSYHWDNDPSKIVEGDTAAISDAGMLLTAVNKAYRLQSGGDTKIVICGHTHTPVINRYIYPEPGKGADRTKIPSTSIYANCGTWVDGKTCTYVETEVNPSDRKHYVRVKKYPGNDLYDDNSEGFVLLR